jgi:hypothetical protein
MLVARGRRGLVWDSAVGYVLHISDKLAKLKGKVSIINWHFKNRSLSRVYQCEISPTVKISTAFARPTH